MPKVKKGKRSKGGSNSTAEMMLSSHHLTARGMTTIVASDKNRKMPRWEIGSIRPPRNFLSAVHWVQATFTTTMPLSGVGSITEGNQSFTLNQNVPDYATYVGVYDQYCMFSAVVRVAANFATELNTGTIGRIYTAIDYDNTSNLGSVNAIQAFGSCEVNELIHGQSVERYVEPAGVSLLAGSSLGLTRSWVNSSTPGAPHYGVRVMATLNGSLITTLTVDIAVTVIVGFRNNI